MAAAICFRSARVSLRLRADNGVHLPVQIHLLHCKQVQVIGFVQSALWTLKAALYNVLQHNFQRLTVVLIHGQQEEGHHEKNHAQRRGAGAQHAAGEKEKGAPTSAPRPKQISCRFVNPKATFVLICDKSLGMVT